MPDKPSRSPAVADWFHVLWADGETPLRSTLPALLRARGMLLHAASDFSQARQLLHTKPIQLAFLNVMLQEESGFAFAEWIRQTPPLQHIDIVFVSDTFPAHLYQDTASRRFDALAFLDKPLTLPSVLDLLQQVRTGQLQKHSQALPPPTTPQQTLAPEQFLMDPEEWADALFSIKESAQAPEGRHKDELLYPDSQASAIPQALQDAGPRVKEPTEERLPPTSQLKHTATTRDTYIPPSEDPDTARKPNPLLSLPWPSAPTPEAKAAALSQRCEEAIQAQQIDLALRMAREAFALHPVPTYRAKYAWTLFLSAPHDHDNLQRVEQMLQQALQQDPDQEQIYLFLARLFQYQRRFEDAISLCRSALSHRSGFQEVYRELRLLELKLTR